MGYSRTRWFNPEDRRAAVLWGSIGGFAGMLTFGLAYGLSYLLAGPQAIFDNPVVGTVLGALVLLGGPLCLVCGALAARATGRVRAGTLAGWGVGPVYTLAFVIPILASEGAFQFSHQIQTTLDKVAWVVAVAVYLLIVILIGGLIGMALAMLGGLVGRALHR